MVSFSVNIKSALEIKRIFTANKSLFLSCLVSRGSLYLISYSVDYYFHFTLPVISQVGLKSDEYKIFRIPCSEFLNMLCEGPLVFEFSDEMITAKFSKYTMSFPPQQDSLSPILDKMELLNKYKDFPRVDISAMQDMIRIGNKLNANIICEDNYWCINHNNIQIYKKFECFNFTIHAKLLRLLSMYSNSIYNISNYLFCVTDEVAVIVQKTRLMSGSDVDYINSRKVAFSFKFDMRDMLVLIKNLKLSEGDLFLNFDKNLVMFKANRNSYSSKLKVETISNSKQVVPTIDMLFMDNAVASLVPSCSMPIIKVPGTVANIISLFNKSVTLEIKKKFQVFRIGDVSVVFRGELVDAI